MLLVFLVLRDTLVSRRKKKKLLWRARVASRTFHRILVLLRPSPRPLHLHSIVSQSGSRRKDPRDKNVHGFDARARRAGAGTRCPRPLYTDPDPQGHPSRLLYLVQLFIIHLLLNSPQVFTFERAESSFFPSSDAFGLFDNR